MADQDNREEQCNVKSCSEYSENHDINCMASESICEKCNYGENMPKQVTIDSGADVCEWEEVSYRVFKTSCYQAGYLDDRLNYTALKHCNYCGKPITIKGE